MNFVAVFHKSSLTWSSVLQYSSDYKTNFCDDNLINNLSKIFKELVSEIVDNQLQVFHFCCSCYIYPSQKCNAHLQHLLDNVHYPWELGVCEGVPTVLPFQSHTNLFNWRADTPIFQNLSSYFWLTGRLENKEEGSADASVRRLTQSLSPGPGAKTRHLQPLLRPELPMKIPATHHASWCRRSSILSSLSGRSSRVAAVRHSRRMLEPSASAGAFTDRGDQKYRCCMHFLLRMLVMYSGNDLLPRLGHLRVFYIRWRHNLFGNKSRRVQPAIIFHN